MPGYAIYQAGILVESGTLQITLGRDLPYRLQELAEALSEFDTPDVLVVEDIPLKMRGGFRAGHGSLLKSEGAVYACVRAPLVLQLKPAVWHRWKPTGWEKGDADDAEAMGHAVYEIVNFLEKVNRDGSG